MKNKTFYTFSYKSIYLFSENSLTKGLIRLKKEYGLSKKEVLITQGGVYKRFKQMNCEFICRG